MIISERVDKNQTEFEAVLKKSHSIIQEEAKADPSYFFQRSANDFEEDIFDCLCTAAKGTPFDKSIELISKFQFPDIVVKKFYGVEVKTTKQNHWKSTGNSVLETTRIADVQRIYIFFGKLTNPLDFKYRLYQECLYDIAVTHSPRYLIDMELNFGDSIFDKLGISYDELRHKDNPIKFIVSYYRQLSLKLKSGELPWWMDGGESPETLVKPTISLWSNLEKEKQVQYKNEAMARFPEMFGRTSPSKYKNCASWLAARYGVVDAALRDRFSAGGKVNLKVGARIYKSLPRVFLHLYENIPEIIEAVMIIEPEEAKHYWNLSFEPTDEKTLVSEWTKKLISYSGEWKDNSEHFVNHLLQARLS